MKTLKFAVEYEIGQTVYIRNDPDQHERVVIGYRIAPNQVYYELAHKTDTSSHFDFELSADKDVLKTTSN